MEVGPSTMTKSVFIAGDWGTTNLRLYLCQYSEKQALQVLDTLTGPGAAKVEGDFEQVFFDLTAQWLAKHGTIPVILSGMVGSTIGWTNAPYLHCPATYDEIVSGQIHFQSRGIEFSIVCGLQTTNPLGASDLMRGEELQLLGWMRSVSPSVSAGTRVVVLPGTHNKWARVNGDTIETFVTALTGEVYALLAEHSVLISDSGTGDVSAKIYMQGVNAARKLKAGQLLHALFTTRSRQVIGELSALEGASYLSGLLVGADIIGSLGLMETSEGAVTMVDLIGAPSLCDRYHMALASFGIRVNICDATQLAMAGYEAIYKSLYRNTL